MKTAEWEVTKAPQGFPDREGVIRPQGRAVTDDTGTFYPLGISFFWAMQDFKGNRPHYDANADWIAQKGFDYARILTEVDWAHDREINPTLPKWHDWADVLRGVIDDLYDRGVRVEITIRGKGTAADSMWLAREVGNIIIDNRQHKVMNVEMANEFSVTNAPVSIEDMSRMATHLKGVIPNILALSNGEEPELRDAAKRLGLTGWTRHIDRGTGDYKWRQVRQGYDFKGDAPFVGSSNEPPGPASSVATNENPLQLAMMRAVGILCGGAMYVLHTGTGVYGDGRPHPSAGARPANFWEIPNIDAIVEALRGVDDVLPPDMPNWRVANTGWVPPNPVAPFQPHHHWEGDHGDGVNKAYSAMSPDGKFCQMPCGVRGHVTLTASYPLRAVTVYDPLSRLPLPGFEDRSFAQGESMDLPGGGQDAMVAYVIHGLRA